MLLDSNIIIYSAEPQYQSIRDLIRRHSPSVSAISYVEVLDFARITAEQIAEFTEFFNRAPMIDIDRPILDRAVALRQQRKMSLGDAIIAATALVHGLTLVTRNVADFGISNLKVLDPLAGTP